MPDIRRLMQFIESAPAGTMVPVESLRELVVGDGEAGQDATETPRMLSPVEAADFLHIQLGGRKRSAAAVRKIMRTGFRGVVLKSYSYGRERRTTEADLRAFIAQIGVVPRSKLPEQIVVPAIVPSTARGFQVESDADPAEEIAVAQERFRRWRQPPRRTAPRQRRASGGV